MSAIEIRVVREVPADFYGPALRTFLTACMAEAHTYLTDPGGDGRPPVDEGTLRNSMTPGNGFTEVDPRDPPTYARVGPPEGAKSRDGRALVREYGSILDQSDKTHYRGTVPYAGQLTKGWFSSVKPFMESRINGDLINILADGIEAAWQR